MLTPSTPPPLLDVEEVARVLIEEHGWKRRPTGIGLTSPTGNLLYLIVSADYGDDPGNLLTFSLERDGAGWVENLTASLAMYPERAVSLILAMDSGTITLREREDHA